MKPYGQRVAVDVMNTVALKAVNPRLWRDRDPIDMKDIWDCFELGSEREVKQRTGYKLLVGVAMEDGKTLEEGYSVLKNGKQITGNYKIYTDPYNALISAMAITQTDEKREEHFMQLVPYIDGMENVGTVSELRPYKNGIEGDIIIDMGDFELCAYLHYFAQVADKIAVGDKIRFKLSAFALNMEDGQVELMKAMEPMFELRRRQFLAENPFADVSKLQIDSRHMRILSPKHCTSGYEFRGTVIQSHGNMLALTRHCLTADMCLYDDRKGTRVEARMVANTKTFKGKGELPELKFDDSLMGAAWFMAEIVGFENKVFDTDNIVNLRENRTIGEIEAEGAGSDFANGIDTLSVLKRAKPIADVTYPQYDDD